MDIQKRIVQFVSKANWYILGVGAVLGLINLPLPFTVGLVAGGLIVTVNFHLLARTLKTALSPDTLVASHNVVIAKYYLRFTISGVIIFILVTGRLVDPLGLILGLSVVVVSILLATLREISKLIFKEAV